MPPEAWLSGPIPGIDPYLMPLAHSLLQSRVELTQAVDGLTGEQLRARPGGAASIGFHLRHIAGSIDRLLTYARDEMLTEEQRNAVKAEGTEGSEDDPGPLLSAASAAIDRALAQLRGTSRESLLDAREVGRAKLPSTVLGLLFHVAEHTQRHTGQVIATAKVVRSPAS